MILQVILDALVAVLKATFSFIRLPEFPSFIASKIDWVIDTIFNNLGWITFFVRWRTLQVALPALIILLNFDKLYKFTMWILRKIPCLGIE